MSKRKDIDKEEVTDSDSEEKSAEESSEDDEDVLDVEFEWFDPQPEHDFQGLKTLLRQLFDADAQEFDLSALVDLVLAQPLLGSTVKVDGNKTDPYAFLTVLNITQHKNNAAILQLSRYLQSQSKRRETLSQVNAVLEPSTSAHVGLILTERLINIPPEVVPPMYKMLLEEISWALAEKEPYDFSHFLIYSKTYQEVASAFDDEDSPKPKKQKRTKRKSPSETFYFHPEDEVLQKHATTYCSFPYLHDSADSDSRRTFQDIGIKPEGHLILLEAAKFEAAVRELQQYSMQT